MLTMGARRGICCNGTTSSPVLLPRTGDGGDSEGCDGIIVVTAGIDAASHGTNVSHFGSQRLNNGSHRLNNGRRKNGVGQTGAGAARSFRHFSR